MVLRGGMTKFFDTIEGFFDWLLLEILLSSSAWILALCMVFQLYLCQMPIIQDFLRMLHRAFKPKEAYWRNNNKNPWHRKPWLGSRFLHTFGLNIVVFQIYYCNVQTKKDGERRNDQAFIWSVVWLMFESFAISSVFGFLSKIHRCNCEDGAEFEVGWADRSALPGCCVDFITKKITTSESKRSLLSTEPAEESEEEESEEENAVWNVYMDISRKFRLVLFIFIAQMGLMLEYVYFLNTDPDSHDVGKVSTVKWFLGVLLTIIAGECGKEDGKDEVGAKFESRYWRKLILGTMEEHPELKVRPYLGAPLFYFSNIPFHREWQLRRVLDFFMNNICRTILLGTSAIILSTEEPLDFIKDVLAIFFICRLDDYDDPKTWDDTLKAFKAKRLHLPHKGVAFPALPYESEETIEFVLNDHRKKFEFHRKDKNGGTIEGIDIEQLVEAGERKLIVNGVRNIEVPVGEEHKLHKVQQLRDIDEKKKTLIKSLGDLKFDTGSDN